MMGGVACAVRSCCCWLACREWLAPKPGSLGLHPA
jgi:hypothetical protein